MRKSEEILINVGNEWTKNNSHFVTKTENNWSEPQSEDQAIFKSLGIFCKVQNTGLIGCWQQSNGNSFNLKTVGLFEKV